LRDFLWTRKESPAAINRAEAGKALKICRFQQLMNARASRTHVRQSAALKPKRPPLREKASHSPAPFCAQCGDGGKSGRTCLRTAQQSEFAHARWSKRWPQASAQNKARPVLSLRDFLWTSKESPAAINRAEAGKALKTCSFLQLMNARASRAHVRQSAALKPKRPPLRKTAEGETINAGGVFKTGECSEYKYKCRCCATPAGPAY